MSETWDPTSFLLTSVAHSVESGKKQSLRVKPENRHAEL